MRYDGEINVICAIFFSFVLCLSFLLSLLLLWFFFVPVQSIYQIFILFFSVLLQSFIYLLLCWLWKFFLETCLEGGGCAQSWPVRVERGHRTERCSRSRPWPVQTISSHHQKKINNNNNRPNHNARLRISLVSLPFLIGQKLLSQWNQLIRNRNKETKNTAMSSVIFAYNLLSPWPKQWMWLAKEQCEG